MLDLEAKPGGDKLLGNGASIPVELAGSQYIKDDPDPPDDPKPEDDPDEGEDPEENNEGGGQNNA